VGTKKDEAGARRGTATFVVDREVETEVSRIRVLKGPDEGLERRFASARITLGSGDRADVQLGDPTVSRVHCELLREPNGTRVRDLASKNGTWVAGCRLVEGVVSSGAQLQLGRNVLQLDVDRRRLSLPQWTGGDTLGSLYGTSAAMHRVFGLLARLASRATRVLVLGETGTGKELVARTLHALGPRAAGPFVVVDGASLSSDLAAMELFGHTRGAFTGADTERRGAFERAHGGTLFLDEVGELPPDVQSKLLRVLEEGVVKRLGAEHETPVDVRVVSATHRSLAQMVNEGRFREDLFYRLAEAEVRVPPLRERLTDVGGLAVRLAGESARDAEAEERVRQALARYPSYPWPGNVRELRSFVRRAVVLGPDAAMPTGGGRQRMPPVRLDLPFNEAKLVWQEEFTRRYLEGLLDQAGGNVTEAARRAGLSRSHIYRLLDD
jgi:DNA-binding NtrC family response regulator